MLGQPQHRVGVVTIAVVQAPGGLKHLAICILRILIWHRLGTYLLFKVIIKIIPYIFVVFLL